VESADEVDPADGPEDQIREDGDTI
jgi:hypothetical protein